MKYLLFIFSPFIALTIKGQGGVVTAPILETMYSTEMGLKAEDRISDQAKHVQKMAEFTRQTAEAIKQVLSGRSFRDAYRDVGTNLNSIKSMNPENGIKTRTSTGTAGNLRLDKLKDFLTALKKDVSNREKRVQTSLKKLLNQDVKPFSDQ